MKKSFFLVGLLAFCIVLSISGLYIYQLIFSNHSTSSIEGGKSYNAAEIRTVTIATTRENVHVSKGTGNEIKLELSGKSRKGTTLKSEQKGDELIIQVTHKGLNFDFFNFSSAELTVVLPEKQFERLQVRTTSGDQALRDVGAENLDIATVSGEIEAGNLAGSDLVAKTVSGDFELADWTGNVTATTVSGELQLEHLKGDKIMGKTVSGDVNVEDLIGKEFQVSTVSGEVNLEGTAEMSNVTTISGSVTLELQKTGKSVELHSVSGDLEVMLPKEAPFILESKTVSGDIQIDRDGFQYTDKSKGHVAGSLGEGGPSLTFKTTSGDVTISD
ncbi:MAG: DUF4097 domain-containing protein [Gorillibacterium sp.]|nr:DUF4097 domain-containing protein [Gorillibacterium sp.]